MNSKKAKLLRKMVRQNIEGNPKFSNMARHAYVEIEKRRKFTEVDEKDGGKKVQVATGQLIVAQGTLRGMYLHLKKAFKRGELRLEPVVKLDAPAL